MQLVSVTGTCPGSGYLPRLSLLAVKSQALFLLCHKIHQSALLIFLLKQSQHLSSLALNNNINKDPSSNDNSSRLDRMPSLVYRIVKFLLRSILANYIARSTPCLFEYFLLLLGSVASGRLGELSDVEKQQLLQLRLVTERPIKILGEVKLFAKLVLLMIGMIRKSIQKKLRLNFTLCISSTGTGDRCCVCWDAMGASEDTVIHPKCRNSWHKTCIESIARHEQGYKGWIPCPFCRQPLNRESRFVSLLRSIPSFITAGGWRILQTASKKTCVAGICISVTALSVCIPISRGIVDAGTFAVPSRMLLVSPMLLIVAIIVVGAALAVEQYRIAIIAPIVMPKLWILAVNGFCFLAVVQAGREVQIPCHLAWQSLLTHGLQQNYDDMPEMETTYLWNWMGWWFSAGIGIASAGLAIAIALFTGALRFIWRL